eukprot:g60754.t1
MRNGRLDLENGRPNHQKSSSGKIKNDTIVRLFTCVGIDCASNLVVIPRIPLSNHHKTVRNSGPGFYTWVALINNLPDVLYPTQTQKVGGTLCNECQNHCTDAVYQLQTATHQCSNCNGHTDSNFNLGPIPPHHTRNHQTSTNLPAPARSPYHQQTHYTACKRTKSSEHCTSATATYHAHLDLNSCTLTSTRLVFPALYLWLAG